MSAILNPNYTLVRFMRDLKKINIGGREQALPFVGMAMSIAITTPGIAHAISGMFFGFSTTPIYLFGISSAAICALLFARAIVKIYHQTNRFKLKNNDQFWREFQSSEPFAAEDTDILLGYTTDKGLPLRLPMGLLGHHAYTFGTTGSGKTVIGVLVIAFQQIMRGGGLGFMDGKLDSKTQKLIYWFACLCGRREDFLLLNPADESNSNSWNAILYGDTGAVVSKIMTLMPAVSGAADYYRSLVLTALTNIVGAIKCLGRPYCFEDLCLILSNRRALMQLKQWVSVPEHKNKDAIKTFFTWMDGYERIIAGEDDPKIDVNLLKKEFSGIVARMGMFTNGSFKYVCNSYDPEINLVQNILDKKIIYVALPTMGKPEEARIIGKMFVSDLRGAIAEIQAMDENCRPGWKGDDKTAPIPPFIWELDEFGSYAEGGDADKIFEQGRSSGVIA